MLFKADEYLYKILFHGTYLIQCLAFIIVSTRFIFWITSVKHRLHLLNGLLRLVCFYLFLLTFDSKIRFTEVNF